MGSKTKNPDALAGEARLERARWRSRRGLLELELLLRPFVARRLDGLPLPLLDDYERLLEFDDLDVHEWILDRRLPPAEMQAIIAEIRECQGRNRQETD